MAAGGAFALGGQPSAESAHAGPSAIGGGCGSDADCVSGLFCAKEHPGGQRLKKCPSTADCGPGAICSDEKKCYRACQTDADCSRKGYACVGTAPNKFCDFAGESHEEG